MQCSSLERIINQVPYQVELAPVVPSAPRKKEKRVILRATRQLSEHADIESLAAQQRTRRQNILAVRRFAPIRKKIIETIQTKVEDLQNIAKSQLNTAEIDLIRKFSFLDLLSDTCDLICQKALAKVPQKEPLERSWKDLLGSIITTIQLQFARVNESLSMGLHRAEQQQKTVAPPAFQRSLPDAFDALDEKQEGMKIDS